jgi:thiamine phosphate synthase YjbQ (UPF0047 family)
VFHAILRLSTNAREEFVEVTDDVRAVVNEAGFATAS